MPLLSSFLLLSFPCFYELDDFYSNGPDNYLRNISDTCRFFLPLLLFINMWKISPCLKVIYLLLCVNPFTFQFLLEKRIWGQMSSVLNYSMGCPVFHLPCINSSSNQTWLIMRTFSLWLSVPTCKVVLKDWPKGKKNVKFHSPI